LPSPITTSVSVVSNLWQCFEKLFQIKYLGLKICMHSHAVYISCVTPPPNTPTLVANKPPKLLM
jgi:hypothetical protein